MLAAAGRSGQSEMGGDGSVFDGDPASGDAGFSARQNEVLEVALRLLVEGGDRALTTAALARAANCSKESLYKWFGDRDGLLAAIVTHQASRVRIIDAAALPKTRDEFEAALQLFAEDLLTVLLSDTSLALNRLSVGSVRQFRCWCCPAGARQAAHRGACTPAAGGRTSGRAHRFRRCRQCLPNAVWPHYRRSAHQCAAR